MKSVTYDPKGPIESMVLAESPRPVPKPHEVLIRVVCAGVNRPDVLQRAGLYPVPPGDSPVLGLEVSGLIEEVGEDVTEWKKGDAVTALAPGGGYAEFCAVPQGQVLPIPQGFSFEEAAVLPETWFTVWANLVEMGNLSGKDRLLVHGGSSGIGLTAIQLANTLGAECIVTVGNDEKAEFCRKFGARHAINYRTEKFADRVTEITAGQGVDVILDMVGAPYAQDNVRLLRKDGRLLLIGFLGGSRTEFNFLPVMLKRLRITGSTMRSRSITEKQQIRDALRTHIWPRMDRGELRPYIYQTFPLADVVEAHRLMESSAHIGKILLRVSEA